MRRHHRKILHREGRAAARQEGCRGSQEPGGAEARRRPPARQPRLERPFSKNAHGASRSRLSAPARICWNSCDGGGRASTGGGRRGGGGGHPNWRESALSPPPPPAPRDTAGWESSSPAWWGGGSAMVSRLRGRLQAAPGCPSWAVGSKHTSQVHTRPWPEPPRHSQAGVRRPDDPTWQHRVLLPGPQALLSCRLCTSGLRSSRRLSQCLPTPTGSRSHVVCVKHPHPAAALAPPTPDSQ